MAARAGGTASSSLQAVGHGDPSCVPNAPTPLRALRGKGVSHIACGGARSLALCDAGQVASKTGTEGSHKGFVAGAAGGPSLTVNVGTQPSRQPQAPHAAVPGRALPGAAAMTPGANESAARQAIASQGKYEANGEIGKIQGRACVRTVQSSCNKSEQLTSIAVICFHVCKRACI